MMDFVFSMFKALYDLLDLFTTTLDRDLITVFLVILVLLLFV